MSRSIPPFAVVPSIVLLYLIKSLPLLLPSLVRQRCKDISRFRIRQKYYFPSPAAVSDLVDRSIATRESIQRDMDSLGITRS